MIPEGLLIHGDGCGEALELLQTISPEDHAKVKALAAIVNPLRSVLHKRPDDYGMIGWRDIHFQSDDCIPLEGWYIPANGGESCSMCGKRSLSSLSI